MSERKAKVVKTTQSIHEKDRIIKNQLEQIHTLNSIVSLIRTDLVNLDNRYRGLMITLNAVLYHIPCLAEIGMERVYKIPKETFERVKKEITESTNFIIKSEPVGDDVVISVKRETLMTPTKPDSKVINLLS